MNAKSSSEKLVALQKLKSRIANKEVAVQAKQAATRTPIGFDAAAFDDFVTDHPAFSKLHLVTIEE